jgi:hypothetical protein
LLLALVGDMNSKATSLGAYKGQLNCFAGMKQDGSYIFVENTTM